ncbi:MAG: hypothetical protein Q9211_006251 [Gyalolechia sp. 1 TL-2023]
MAGPDIPYWCVNVPAEQWPNECPDFLLELSERDKKLVGNSDKDYRRLTWSEVKAFVGKVKLGTIQSHDLRSKRRTNFTAFVSKGDIKILYNDWPYGIDERIVHLVVWTKFDLPDDPDTKELTTAMRQDIESYVDRTFRQAVPNENIPRSSKRSLMMMFHSATKLRETRTVPGSLEATDTCWIGKDLEERLFMDYWHFTHIQDM